MQHIGASVAKEKASKYVLLVALTVVLSYLLATWASVKMQMYWQTVEYVYLKSKIDLVKRCDLGQVVILGDSGSAVGIDPNRVAIDAVNLSLIGSGPIESYALLRKVMSCPNRPRKIILSFSSHHYLDVDLFFWHVIVRSGILHLADVADLVLESKRLQDWTAFHSVGLAHSLIVGLPRPETAIETLLDGRALSTKDFNQSEEERIVAARGYIAPPNARNDDRHQAVKGVDRIGDPDIKSGRSELVPPILNSYIERSLKLLEEAGVQVYFLAMPMDQQQQGAFNHKADLIVDKYLYYLKSQRNFRFDVLNSQQSYWPSRFFGDRHNHLNLEGARLFEQKLNDCLEHDEIGKQGLLCPELSNSPQDVKRDVP